MQTSLPAPWKVVAAAGLVCLAAASGVAMANATTQAKRADSLLFSPYKYVPRNFNAATHALQTAVTGAPAALTGSHGLLARELPRLPAITLAFATGECGSEAWGGVPTHAITGVAIPALANAGVGYVISTGGQGEKFTCASPRAFAAFIRRYRTAHLLGIDFDIEYQQTAAEINALVADAADAQKMFPRLRFSFTLATWAGTDAKRAGLNALGATVLQAIQASSLTHYSINLMVMDYGKTSPSVCVVVHGHCDMGQSAIQAVKNLQHTWHVPASKIALTPIAGVNDNRDEVFTLADVDTLVRYARTHGLAGIHFWSLDRDTPCADRAQSKPGPEVCNGTGDPPLAFTRRVLRDLGHDGRASAHAPPAPRRALARH